MSKQKISVTDAAALAVSIARAAGGDMTGLLLQIPKWIKPVAAFAGCLLVIIAIIISSPVIILGSLAFPDTGSDAGVFYADQIVSADAFIRAFKESEQVRFRNAEAVMKSSVSGAYIWNSAADIQVELPRDELLILYSVVYGDYDGQPADFNKLNFLSDSIVVRSEKLAASAISSENSDADSETASTYTYTYSARLKSFTQILEALALDDVQKDRAIVMYRYLYDQDQGAVAGNDISGIDLGDITYSNGSIDVTYFSQKDSRWCNTAYGKTGTIGRSGCGPTALAVVISSLTDTAVLPTVVAGWSARNGYYVEGGGSLHSLIPDGAANWDVPVKKAGYDWQSVVDALADGKLVIAIMGKGHFTSSGHYIVLRGVTGDGKIMVADPASVKRSNELWDAGIIVNEVRKNASAGGAFWILG